MFKIKIFVNNFTGDIMSEIIKFEDFKKKKTLSDEDIKSLFLGLVNLIKSSAIDDVSNKIKAEYKKNSIELNNTLLELKIKNEIIDSLKQENYNLKSKTNKLSAKIEELKRKLSNISKID